MSGELGCRDVRGVKTEAGDLGRSPVACPDCVAARLTSEVQGPTKELGAVVVGSEETVEASEVLVSALLDRRKLAVH